MVAPLLPVAVPASVTELVGRVTVCALPALTVGGWLGGGGALTVIVTAALALNPLLSVAVNVNTYAPGAVSPVTVVVRFAAVVMTPVTGPLVWVQAVELMVAPPLPVAVPVRVTVLVGRVIVWPLPALTVGG